MMIRFLKVTVILFFTLFISCKKDDNVIATAPPVAFAVQYPIDSLKIYKFMTEYHMDVTATDYEVTFTKIPTPNTANLKSIRQEYYPLTNPIGKRKIVTKDGIDYKVYYIPFREGINEAPTSVDSVFTSYKGRLVDNTSFDQTQDPLWFTLGSVVTGWKEVFPFFKAGIHTVGTDGTVTYSDFGTGVMFLPSAFGYYNVTKGSIPAYSPLIFSFKLNKVNYVDHDFDRIDSKDEDVNGNGDLTDDDTDGDGKPNYLDTDDDGDGYATKFELKDPAGGYYSFANIPLCSDNKKKHLSKVCH